MRNFNVVKLDSKGRLIIPYHIRELLDVREGAEFAIVSNHNNEIKLMPLLKGRVEEISLLMSDTPGALARIMELIASKNADIVMSQSRSVERGVLAEWHAIIDINGCKDFKKLVNDVGRLDVVRKIEVEEK